MCIRDSLNPIIAAVTKENFQCLHVIGKGGFGRVWRVEKKKDQIQYAMKEMSKARILFKHNLNSVLNEQKLLTQLRHPFLVNMEYAFQDRENLYLVLDLKTGGDLRYHICRRKKFSEEQTSNCRSDRRVYSGVYDSWSGVCPQSGSDSQRYQACKSSVRRKWYALTKKKGYLHITDFGVARLWNANNASDTSGTPGYMGKGTCNRVAPEVMCRSNHGIAADYFALGVIAYECMMGRVAQDVT
eukprot:TRINITY_DN3653_c0_g2_i15.p2 TRINITY_DN3653_c0_g2~~TRINITY_DN3653_c0_g2_i15.p2  ORF type:complete len:242 (+),score=36.93 TRINITY_DN3653_c0_g2_i15:74-799(+)